MKVCEYFSFRAMNVHAAFDKEICFERLYKNWPSLIFMQFDKKKSLKGQVKTENLL